MTDSRISHLSAYMKAAIPTIEQTIIMFAPKGFKVEYTAMQEWFHHGKWSLHHSGNAVDIRTKTLPDHGVGQISKTLGLRLQENLDRNFGVKNYLVLVNDAGPKIPHIHIQYSRGVKASTPGDYEKRNSSSNIA